MTSLSPNIRLCDSLVGSILRTHNLLNQESSFDKADDVDNVLKIQKKNNINLGIGKERLAAGKITKVFN